MMGWNRSSWTAMVISLWWRGSVSDVDAAADADAVTGVAMSGVERSGGGGRFGAGAALDRQRPGDCRLLAGGQQRELRRVGQEAVERQPGHEDRGRERPGPVVDE